jgi:hypothetical protein
MEKTYKIMGREFDSLEKAIHWVEISLKMTEPGVAKYRLARILIKLKGEQNK